MRVKKYKTLYQITFMSAVFPINCYLLEHEKTITLIDAGLAFCSKGIIKVCDKIGKPISRIILTHTHSDHTGAVNGLKSFDPNIPICVSGRDYDILMGDMTLRVGEPNYPIRGGFDEKSRFKADLFLADGDIVDGLQIISVPGHTPGSIAIYDSNIKAMIVGDTFVSKGAFKLAGDKYPLFPFPAQATWDMESVANNAKRLLEYEIDILAVGHGPMLHNPKPAMEAAIENGWRKANAKK